MVYFDSPDRLVVSAETWEAKPEDPLFWAPLAVRVECLALWLLSFTISGWTLVSVDKVASAADRVVLYVGSVWNKNVGPVVGDNLEDGGTGRDIRDTG